MSNKQSISEERSPMADGLTSNSQTAHRRRPRACQHCRARKVKCMAASDKRSDAKCCESRMRPHSKTISNSRSRLRKKENEPWYRKQRSTSREESQELPPEAMEGLNALLHLSTITPNERSLLSAFLPPEPKMYPDLNDVMRGQVFPSAHEQEAFSSSTYSLPMNDFDVFFALDEGSDGDGAE
jgi:hypothetical protein